MCNAKATHIFSAKNINVFAIFQERNYNVTLADNFVKFWTTGPWSFVVIEPILGFLKVYMGVTDEALLAGLAQKT